MKTGERPVPFVWQYQTRRFGFGPAAALDLLLGYVPLPVQTEYARFATHHGLCAGCRIGAGRWYRVGSVLRPLIMFLLAVGVMLSVVWMICVLSIPADAPQRSEAVALGRLGLPALAIGVVGLRLVTALRAPATVRTLLRRPFALHAAHFHPS